MELEQAKRQREMCTMLLRFYREVYKDVSNTEKGMGNTEKGMARLLQLILDAMNVADVFLYVVDYGFRNFICCSDDHK